MERRPNRVLGGVHDRFWDYCGRGELRLQRCDACAALCWPPVDACGICGGTGLAWERLSGKGSIASWCVFERDYYQGAFPLPWPTILVELEEGPLFVSNPGDFAADDAAFGMGVEVAFLPCEDDAGRFDLPVFNRIREAAGAPDAMPSAERR